jgi:tetratricopeptide (TPR) repeat protein
MSEMKKNWFRILRNSVFGFLCLSFVAAWASAQTPAAQLPPLQPLDDALLTVLGIDKAQLDTAGLQGDELKNRNQVRTDIQEGVRAFSLRDAQNAMVKLEAAYKTDPSLPPPSVILARLCFASNDQNVVNLGRGFLERAVNFNATSPEPYLLLGRLALTEGRLTDAELNFKKAQSLTPAAPGAEAVPGTVVGWSADRINTFLKEIHAGLVSVSEQRQQWETAKNELDAWIKLDPMDAMAKFRLGRVMFMQVAAQTSGTKDYEPARLVLTEAYKLAQEDTKWDKKDVTAVPPAELAMLQLFSGNAGVEEAKKEVKKLEESADGFAENKEKARVYSALSQWYLQQNNPAKAGELAAKAKTFDEASPALKQLSAVMHYYANDPKAVVEFEAMNQEAPDDFVASNYLALLLAESTDTATSNKAVRLAELNVRLNPKSPEAVSTLGWVYHKAGRTNEAMQVYGALMQAVQQGQGQINADTAYYMARVIIDSPGDSTQKVGAVIRLLEQALGSTGPFKHRPEATTWYEQLTGGKKAGVPGTTNLVPSPTPTPTPPQVTPPVVPPAPGGGTTPKPTDN